ncbi:hypothetical protein HanRHA438_Chr17g0819101 [Helianthus annuus]|nr:hypothetical protein HanHA89_Chr17g0711621 [Helianthus annuus]KAJ0632885.1 hypothetical protein HanLR1_Chr17g0670191 [Helianthus annuus]KAJ0826866.1 hypothetical protein HanRHA438_Chr17g0819101 [Helianthus annuus]
MQASPNVLFDPVHNSCIDLDVEKCPLLSEFSSILDYMNRIPVKKAMIDQKPLYRSHISRFWINAKYDEESKVISSVVEVDGKLETILVTEALVREVMNFPDEANYPTRFPECMVKGCMLRLGYRNTLNTGNYLKSKFQKSFKFLIHCILITLSHTKGSFDQMRDYQMNMLTALVLNKKYNFSHIIFHYMVENLMSDVRTWRYPCFVQMMIDRAYPGIDRNIKGDLLVQANMSNNTLKNLVKYHPNHPEPDLVIENFGLLRDANYVDPDPENHQNWRNQEEMKEALYAVELKILQSFKPTKNEWYVKESGRRRRFATPVAEGEGSSSKPKKIQKKKKQTMLIDESDEDVPEMNVESEQETTGAENIKLLDDVEGDDVDKDTTSSSSSSEYEVIDAKERERRMREEVEQERLIRKRKREEKEDAPYEPSPEHVSVSQSSPKGKKKAAGRKRNTPKIKVSKRPQKIIHTHSTPPRQPTPPQSPIHQSPPRQPTPQQSPRQPTPPLHSTPPRQPTPQRQPSPLFQSTPPPHQPYYSSQDLFGTSPLTQAQPGSSSRSLPIPQDNLLDVDFEFANNSQVLKLEKRIEDVIAENKKLAAECKKIADREKTLAGKVQRLESENKVLTLKIEVDQTEIDVLKVRVSELEEEKNRRESENEYYKLKNKELMAAKALHEHKFYMLNRVVESMLETSVEQKYEELKLEDLRAKRKAELERQMKDKGKGVEGSSEMSIVPSMVIDNPEPISAVPGIVEEEVPSPKLIGGEDEEDDEDDDEDEFVYSASSHSSKGGDDDDDAAGGSGVRVTEASKEKVVEDLLNDTVNEESGEAERKGESSKTQIVEHHEPLFLRLDVYMEMLKDVNPEIPIDLEADLESFDINKQQDYKYNYVEDADIYDRVEVEECSDNEEVSEDTSKLPTLMEFFAAENRDELRQKVTEAVNDNVFECLRKEAEQKGQSNADKEDQSEAEEIDRSKWFKDSHERKFKRPLKFFQRDRNVSLGDIISWGFLPQVNAYAIRREYGVQYFARLYDIMSLPWWDVDELAKVRVLEYKVRKNDTAMWGYIKYEQLKSFRKWKPHRLRRVQRIDPETGAVEIILNVKPPRTMKTILMPEMEQDFYKGFIDWVYSCRTTEAIITYRAGGELRDIHVYDPMWLVNCSAKDIECLFIHKIRYSPADKEQALQFQRVVSLCVQKGINSDNKCKSSWWSLDKKMKKKAKRERERENQKIEENRGKFMKQQEKEEKARKKENEKIRVALSRKPKPKEEKFKAI